jgi:hypothetical protein
MLETDTSGESFERSLTTDSRVVAGHIVTFGGHVRRETGPTASTGWIRLYWKDSGGAETLGYTEIAVAPSSVIWERYEASIPIPVGAVGWRFRGQQVSGSLLWDDMLLSDVSLLRPVDWRQETNGTATLDSYATRELPFEGGYALRCVASAADNDSNDATLRWMEDKRLPRSNVYEVLHKIRPYLYDDAQNGSLLQLLASKESGAPEESGRVTRDALREVVELYGLLGDEDFVNLLRAEGLTSMPAILDPGKTGGELR